MPSKTTIKKIILIWRLRLTVMIIPVTTAIAFIALLWRPPAYAMAGAAVIAYAFLWWYIGKYFAGLSYKIFEDKLVVKYGVIVKKTTTIPRIRMMHSCVISLPLEKMLDVKIIRIYGSGSKTTLYVGDDEYKHIEGLL